MRIVFMGSPEFSVPTLRRIVHGGHAVVAVYTQPPRSGGRRGLEIVKTRVHEAAAKIGIPVYTPVNLADAYLQDAFSAHAADVGVVIAYGLLLPKAILKAPKLGCVNLHASLLPRWRGAAPIQRAIMAGDLETGVDLMRIGTGLDTGPVAMRELIPIRSRDTAGDLTGRMAEIAAGLAAAGLRALERGTLKFREQSRSGVCYARKVEKREAAINWRGSAAQVRNHIHGMSPAPGAFSHLSIRDRDGRFKFYRVETVTANGAPGTVLDREMTIACGDGAIRILEGQREGRPVLAGGELMRRDTIPTGSIFTPSEKLSIVS
jgi:methionyl-tRNA formyltransferase